MCPLRPLATTSSARCLEIIKRERINVVMPTDENIVKALSEQRDQFPIELLLPRRDTIDLCQDKHALNLFLRRRAIPAPLTYNVNYSGS